MRSTAEDSVALSLVVDVEAECRGLLEAIHLKARRTTIKALEAPQELCRRRGLFVNDLIGEFGELERRLQLLQSDSDKESYFAAVASAGGVKDALGELFLLYVFISWQIKSQEGICFADK